MIMKNHILAALREQFALWEELLARLDDKQITAPLTPSVWSSKDVIAHLWAWQQRTLARIDAGRLDRAPDFPAWEPGVDPEVVSATDQTNWFHEAGAF
jgi:hypothetical protein